MKTPIEMQLLLRVANLAPVTDVSIGDPNDRRTWQVSIMDAAAGVPTTAAQRQAVAAAVASFVVPGVPAPTAEDVRTEASRRMCALVGARDAAHLAVKLSNAQREGIRLLRRGASAWSPEEQARAAVLEATDAAIEAIRAASNALEGNPQLDYQAAKHWPK